MHVCAVSGCGRETRRPLCYGHAKRRRVWGDVRADMPLREDRRRADSADVRFWRKVDRSGACWEWDACRDRQGYGRFRPDPRRVVAAHRYAWELEHGPVPAGSLVLHRCDNPPCVRVAHLYLGDAFDNMRDSFARGRHPAPPHRRARRAVPMS